VILSYWVGRLIYSPVSYVKSLVPTRAVSLFLDATLPICTSSRVSAPGNQFQLQREVMNHIKILLLMSLIPLSLLGDAVMPSPELQSQDNPEGEASFRVSASSQAGRRSRLAGGSSLFRDDKRFSPTGSNPLHNL
jgi:hypothetical protein